MPVQSSVIPKIIVISINVQLGLAINNKSHLTLKGPCHLEKNFIYERYQLPEHHKLVYNFELTLFSPKLAYLGENVSLKGVEK